MIEKIISILNEAVWFIFCLPQIPILKNLISKNEEYKKYIKDCGGVLKYSRENLNKDNHMFFLNMLLFVMFFTLILILITVIKMVI